MSEPLVVIGIGHDGAAGLSAEARAHLAAAKALAGGKRHLAFFPDFTGETLQITADIPGLAERLREVSREKKTVVLASGDPLFYGVGASLLKFFPKEQLLFLPHVSAVQLAFARLKESWHDARLVSLHGRPSDSILAALADRPAKIAVLTENGNHPAAIGRFLARHGVADEFDWWVAENLGGSTERLSQWTIDSIQSQEFSPLNVLVLLRKAATSSHLPTVADLPLLGIADDRFAHRAERRGMITKRETRLMSLAHLELRAGDVVWDIGAGSGSVSIEAARLSSALRVIAIEQNENALGHIEENLRRFHLPNVEVIFGSAPEIFKNLPAPTAVFIGGAGGRLEEIIPQVAGRLPTGGRLVMNCITIESFSQGWRSFAQHGLKPQATSVQLARSKPLGSLHALEPDSLIFILRGIKS